MTACLAAIDDSGGLLCRLPEGHPGLHRATVDLSAAPEVGKMLAAHINELEASVRRNRRAWWGMAIAAGLNIGAAAYNLIRAFSQ